MTHSASFGYPPVLEVHFCLNCSRLAPSQLDAASAASAISRHAAVHGGAASETKMFEPLRLYLPLALSAAASFRR